MGIGIRVVGGRGLVVSFIVDIASCLEDFHTHAPESAVIPLCLHVSK
jgi:hypothetical protein